MAGIFVPRMKKNCAFVLILVVALTLAFSACDGSKTSPWGDKTIENNDGTPKIYSIYVCGAVKNEGYYEVEEGATYRNAIMQAGLLAQSFQSQHNDGLVNAQKTAIVVQYVADGIPHDCIDVNNAYFALRDPLLFDGLSEAVVTKIADYLEAVGKIRNKKVLREVLGEDYYENYHYKLYVAEADYEKAD